ncbi:HNH endonuclease [Rhodobacteraceae bacterium N5(2021)]|uniref:HNH endonuclease n=1 Tax=Gymnodinialimonas phycosphaerae TaxID=2841589 RepID=A0A975TYI3_9RHOB|nr:HNH endonuclease signature motif containing protein [Gymnodinialimonas phycosphaerae]MBY4893065.1 HNH endonuclease [Gymnodinialimonas phycosphaerae]
MTQHPANRAIRLRNVVCPYCGCDLTAENSTKEHVVGRRFVPKGKLNGHWNLIVNACRPCNNRKADLENDISAITLHPELGEAHPYYDETARAEGQRKAENAISRRTKKRVKDSKEKMKLSVPFVSSISLNIDFTSPPQIDENRAFELARLQLAGFFQLITYQQLEERGYWWTGGYHPLIMVRRADFGNSVIVDFADAVLDWEPRVLGHTAEGFYSVCIRRHPGEECWSWAMQWNGSTRLAGFLGDLDVAKEVAGTLRPLQMRQQELGNGDVVRFRTEVPLKPEDDRLFEAAY